MTLEKNDTRRHDRRAEQVGKDVEFELIKSLFLHRSSLYFGVMAQVMATALSFVETKDRFFLYAGIIHLVIIAGRIIDMAFYDRSTISKMTSVGGSEARKLETRYILGAIISALSIGHQAAYANYYYTGSVSELVLIGIVLASLSSVAGRNFGSARNVNIIVLGIGGPLLLAMIINKDVLIQCAAILIVAAMISARQFATNVRSYMNASILAQKSEEESKKRLNAALETMPNGLIMIDNAGRIVVINPRAKEILDMPRTFEAEGRNLLSMIRLGLRRSRWAPLDPRQFNGQISALLSGGSGKELVQFNNGVTIEASARHSDETEIVGGTVIILEDVSSRIQAQQKVNFLAHHDTMTAIPNRLHLVTLMEDAVSKMRDDQVLGFCLFDIDRFKVINDTLGHSVGDKVIINIAKRMQQIDDERMICARIGGDEFVLVFHGLDSEEEANGLFDAAFGNICSPAMIDGKIMNVRCSGGVSIYTKQDFRLEDALFRSDIALYESKKNPEVIWTLFNREMDEQFRITQETKQDLRKAVSEGALQAVYQPMYTIDGRRIECCEALARWDHPKLGRISPAVFITMAEGMHVIGDITRQILLSACRDCMSWPDHISVSVNLSALDLVHDDIVTLIESALKTTGLEPGRLQVEVTESALADNRENMAKRLKALRELGVKTALDDFGTGYSSLSYLNDLPFDKVKIDRSFITRITVEDRAMTLFNAVVNLSKDLGFEIVVEGVEGDEQLEMIKQSQGVDLIQGFLFGPPMQSEEIVHAAEKLRLLPKQQSAAARKMIQSR